MPLAYRSRRKTPGRSSITAFEITARLGKNAGQASHDAIVDPARTCFPSPKRICSGREAGWGYLSASGRGRISEPEQSTCDRPGPPYTFILPHLARQTSVLGLVRVLSTN